ncbi:hypothetical protein VM1G_12063 [Cytospora mali]|uniref:Uncharacterized protein n=1 Tax=Cytospora mali TaxID=578113 RepID=A0A194VJN2_CYTMA|nr:hypothetical protein VM1G_12063 [Valsa mali]
MSATETVHNAASRDCDLGDSDSENEFPEIDSPEFLVLAAATFERRRLQGPKKPELLEPEPLEVQNTQVQATHRRRRSQRIKAAIYAGKKEAPIGSRRSGRIAKARKTVLYGR